MLPIALIGVGPDWAAVHRGAFERQSRLKISAVYGPAALEAEHLAAELDVPYESSLSTLLNRPGLRGVVVLDAGWLGAFPVQSAIDLKLPVYVAQPQLLLPDLDALRRRSAEEGVHVQPELSERCAPSTMRLRELVATRLGGIQFAAVSGRSPQACPTWEAVRMIDWCRAVIPAPIQDVIRHESPTTGQAPDGPFPGGRPPAALRVVFRPRRAGEPPAAAELSWRGEGEAGPAAAGTAFAGGPADSTRAGTLASRAAQASAPSAGSPAPSEWLIDVACATGAATLSGPHTIRWNTGEASAEEELTEDRSSVHVQLDLFARRIVGGLPPAPTLDDIHAAVRLVGGVAGAES